MNGSERPGVLKLQVAAVDEILASISSARIRRNLGGRQRRQLAIAYEELSKDRAKTKGGSVRVSMDTMEHILNCYACSQQWFTEMLVEFAADDSQK